MSRLSSTSRMRSLAMIHRGRQARRALACGSRDPRQSYGKVGGPATMTYGRGLRPDPARASVQRLTDDSQDTGRVATGGAGRLLHQKVLPAAHPAQALLKEPDRHVATGLIQATPTAQWAQDYVKPVGVEGLYEIHRLVRGAVEDLGGALQAGLELH